MVLDILKDTVYFALLLMMFALILGGLEAMRPAYPMKFIRKELWHDYGYAFLNSIIIFDLWRSFVLLLPAESEPWQLLDGVIQPLPLVLQVFIGLLILDLAVYIRHRFMHVYLWRVHTIHHSPDEINWVTKFRLHPLEILIALTFTSLILFAIGFEGEAIIYANTLLFMCDVLNHANIRLSFPKPLCYLLACPDYHKWHHAAEAGAKDKNFVVVFPFLDCLFGSYYFPRAGVPERCGLITPLESSPHPTFPTHFLHQLQHPFVRQRRGEANKKPA